MAQNFFAFKTLRYIWLHPNCKYRRIQCILKFCGWQFYKRLTHQTFKLEVLPSLKLYCYPDSRSASTVLYCGLYDYNEMNFLLRYLRPEDSFLDIGANIGIYTLLAASQIKSGIIYSFEPLPKNYSRLQENIKINGFTQVQAYEIAISDSVGTVALNLAEGDSMPFINPTATDHTITVFTNTLDNLLKNKLLSNLTLAKMDIEGAEILALKGATTLLKQKRPHVWILEVNNTVNHFGHQKHDLVHFLYNYDYQLYQYSADTNYLTKITLDQQQGNNVLAIGNSAIDFVIERLAEVSLKVKQNI